MVNDIFQNFPPIGFNWAGECGMCYDIFCILSFGKKEVSGKAERKKASM